MHKRTKACSITPKVKQIVWERDKGRCIICGDYNATPSCHYISRAQGGLGIEQNIVTLCEMHHKLYDQSSNRKLYKEYIRMYMQNHYEDWNEMDLIYKKP